MPDKTVWALLDERSGNTSQTLGVAEALGLPFEIKNIRFNSLTRLPNQLLCWNKAFVSSATHHELCAPWPDITISTARRLGLVAAYIKSKSPRTFTAQIQWPGFGGGKLDLVATPLHDRIAEGGSVFLTLGAPHRVTRAKLVSEAEVWKSTLAHLPSPRIAVLIGGGSNPQEFADRHAARLAKFSCDLARAKNASLLITTSRRTGEQMPQQMKPLLDCAYYLYTWQEGGNAPGNPYYGFLGLADAVIATGDSVSMCSEACATGKPVFIYEGEGFMSKKHKAFINALYAKGLARPLTGNDTWFTPPYLLNDSLAVAEQIKTRAAL